MPSLLTNKLNILIAKKILHIFFFDKHTFAWKISTNKIING